MVDRFPFENKDIFIHLSSNSMTNYDTFIKYDLEPIRGY